MRCTKPLRRSLAVALDLMRGRWRWVCTLPLCSVLVALVPFAHTCPPDPGWIAGIYDGADVDELVEAVVSMAGAMERALLMASKPIVIGEGTVGPGEAASFAAILPSGAPARAPPVAN